MRRHLPLLLIIATAIATALVYDRLPPVIPSHWNARGEIDGYQSRQVGAVMLPLVALGIYVLLLVVPRIDPRGENYRKFEGMYQTIILASVAFLCVLHLAILAYSLGYPVSVDRVIYACIAILFIVMGNLLPRARPNWFVGIRTPWTLSNDRVWERTHRAGGYVFFAAGLVLLATLLLAPSLMMPAVIMVSVAITVFSLGYSFWAWRQERGN